MTRFRFMRLARLCQLFKIQWSNTIDSSQLDLVGLPFFYSPLFRLLIVYSQILWLYLKAVSEQANCISRAGTGIYHTRIKMEISCFPISLPPLPDVSASSTAFPFRLQNGLCPFNVRILGLRILFFFIVNCYRESTRER